jgi:hypothetical protein
MKFKVLLVMLGLFTSCIAAQNEESKSLVAISGAHSRVNKESYERITTSKDWTQAWCRHIGTSDTDDYRSLMEIDFDRCMVIAIFRGEQIHVRGIVIHPLITNGESIILRFEQLTYQTIVGDKVKPPETPYAFVVIPKTNREIILEENVQQYLGEPPQWKECMRLKNK